jgi:hypothetical protein
MTRSSPSSIADVGPHPLAGSDSEPSAAPAASPPGAGDRPSRARSGRSPSPWWRFGFPIALVVLIGAIPVLVWAGTQVVLESNDGRLINRVTDPDAPGWEAVLDPTPTNLVLTTNAAGQLEGIAVMILSGEDSGAVLQVPVETLVPIADGSEISLYYRFFLSGEQGVRDGLGDLLDLSFTEARVVATDEWASLVAPVAPLTVNSPDPTVDATGQVVFPKGSIQVPAAQVGTFLGTSNPGATDVARLVRVEAFWRAWIAAVAGAGLDAAPPPVDQGLGRFLVALGAGQVRFVTLPVTEVSPGPPQLYRAPPASTAATVAELVPFPVGPPGSRTTVKMLDGTGQLDHGTEAAIRLGAAGAQVEIIGNAPEFGVTTTQIVYFDETRRAQAEELRVALGVGELVKSDERSVMDATVVLGADALEVPALVPSTTAAASGGTGG